MSSRSELTIVHPVIDGATVDHPGPPTPDDGRAYAAADDDLGPSLVTETSTTTAAEQARAAALTDDGTHIYLSTGCLHGNMVLPDGRTGHQYCQGDTGHAGSKTPAQCKFCGAPCTCPCHLDTPEPDAGPEKCNAFVSEHHRRRDPDGGCPLPPGHEPPHALAGKALQAMLNPERNHQ